MKICLGKPVVNKKKLSKVKIEKPGRGVLREKLQLYLYFIYKKTLNEEQNS